MQWRCGRVLLCFRWARLPDLPPFLRQTLGGSLFPRRLFDQPLRCWSIFDEPRLYQKVLIAKPPRLRPMLSQSLVFPVAFSAAIAGLGWIDRPLGDLNANHAGNHDGDIELSCHRF